MSTCTPPDDSKNPVDRIKRNRRGQFISKYPPKSREAYVCWYNMLRRCTDRSHKSYADYGGRGIVVCDEWKDFLVFFRDMGVRPPNSSVERIDNEKGYNPGNCKWATSTEQNNNKRNNVLINHEGETLSLTQWIKRSGIKRSTVYQRYYVYHWSAERSLGWE